LSDERLKVTSGLPRHREIQGHFAPAAIYLDGADSPDVPVTIAAVDASKLVGSPLSDLHVHACAEVYLAVAPGLRFAVETDQGFTEVASPASVHVPAGVPHRFVVRDAAETPYIFLGVLLDSGA
jgi:hypothetical protein